MEWHFTPILFQNPKKLSSPKHCIAFLGFTLVRATCVPIWSQLWCLGLSLNNLRDWSWQMAAKCCQAIRWISTWLLKSFGMACGMGTPEIGTPWVHLRSENKTSSITCLKMEHGSFASSSHNKMSDSSKRHNALCRFQRHTAVKRRISSWARRGYYFFTPFGISWH